MSETLDRLRRALASRYEIRDEVGHGGMSFVHVAYDRQHDRDVAIKIFPAPLAAAIGSERFEREIAITSRLSHPHVLPLYDSGEAAGTLYFVMPLIRGESLRARLDHEPDGLPLADAMRIADHIAQALDHAHSLGVIHRDVTPDNILLSGDNALLADFGIARLVEGETLTESGMPFGTALYRSPEQASGHARVGPASDIYSLACVLYECLGGKPARAALSNRFSVPVPPLKRRATNGVDAAIARAMSLEPSERFQSAGDFIRALHARAPFRYVGTMMRIAAAALLIAAIGFGARSMFKSAQSDNPRNRVFVGEFQNRTGDPSLASLADMTGDYIARGLAQTGLVEVIDSRAPGVGARSPSTLGASTVVRGTVYKRADQLHFETQVTDAQTGRVLVATEPVEGTASDGTALIEKLRQRLMGNFAAIVGPGFEAWEAATLPPSFDAYEEILAGDAAIGKNDYGTGEQHYLAASRMDTSFTGALTMAAMAASLAHDCELVDSIGVKIQPRLSTLSAVDRGRFEWGSAQCHGNVEQSLVAGRRVLANAPRSISFSLLTGITAIELMRPNEGIRTLSSLSPEEMQFTAAQRQFRTSFLALGWHELGDFKTELSVVRDGLRAMPNEPHFLFNELVALAAQGKTAEINRLLRDEEGGKVQYDRTLWTPDQIRLCVGAELLAHGHDKDGRAMIESAAAWSLAHLPHDGTIPQDINCAHKLLVAAYYGSDQKPVREFYERVLANDSTSFEAHDALGAVAAKQQDLLEVRRMDEWLASHRSREPGRASFSRARIAALLGDNDRAMTLLEASMREGLKGRMMVHFDPDFAPLRSLPRYRALFALRD